MTTPKDDFAAEVARWLNRQADNEARLTSFAFREGQADIEVPPSTSHREVGRWILGIVAEPGVAATLGALDGRAAPMRDLVEAGAFGLDPGDRAAVAARIGVLTSSGLVSRELESDRVTLTELGRAALVVAEGTARAAAEPAIAGRVPA